MRREELPGPTHLALLDTANSRENREAPRSTSEYPDEAVFPKRTVMRRPPMPGTGGLLVGGLWIHPPAAPALWRQGRLSAGIARGKRRCVGANGAGVPCSAGHSTSAPTTALWRSAFDVCRPGGQGGDRSGIARRRSPYRGHATCMPAWQPVGARGLMQVMPIHGGKGAAARLTCSISRATSPRCRFSRKRCAAPNTRVACLQRLRVRDTFELSL